MSDKDSTRQDWVAAIAMWGVSIIIGAMLLVAMFLLWPADAPEPVKGGADVKASTASAGMAPSVGQPAEASAAPISTPPGAIAPALDKPAPQKIATPTDPAKEADETKAGAGKGPGRPPSFWLLGFSGLDTVRRNMLLVLLAGMLGGVFHIVRSAGWYMGNRRIKRRWLPYYLGIPFSSSLLSLGFYWVVFGGIAPELSTHSTAYGICGFAFIVGVFSTEAFLKMQQVSYTIFGKPQPGDDAKQQSTLTPGIENFELSADVIEVTLGTDRNATYKLRVITGDTTTVEALDLPQGVTATFDPLAPDPGPLSTPVTLTLKADQTVVKGTYPFSVRAVSGQAQQKVDLTLIVP